MMREERSDGPGRGFVLVGASLGIIASLLAGLLVAAFLNSWLVVDWVRGIATLAAGGAVAAVLLRAVIETARARLRALGQPADERR